MTTSGEVRSEARRSPVQRGAVEKIYYLSKSDLFRDLSSEQL